MSSCFLIIKNPLKNLVKTFTLSLKKENKIGRTKKYGISLSDEETTIPKNESMIIDFKEGENFIRIKYRVKTKLEKIGSVKYVEPWNWHDCEFLITKEDPLKKKNNDQEEEKKANTSNESVFKETSLNKATSTSKIIREEESLSKTNEKDSKLNEIIVKKADTLNSRSINKRQMNIQISAKEKNELEIKTKKTKEIFFFFFFQLW